MGTFVALANRTSDLRAGYREFCQNNDTGDIYINYISIYVHLCIILNMISLFPLKYTNKISLYKKQMQVLQDTYYLEICFLSNV